MPVMDIHLAIHCFDPVLVGRTVTGAALDASARGPHGEALTVVIASVGILRIGRAAKFAAPYHQRLVQHLALLEIGKQCGDGSINLPGLFL